MSNAETEQLRFVDAHPVTDRLYTTKETLQVTGVTAEQLKDWLKHGYIKPVFGRIGQGKKGYYTWTDMLGIYIFKELVSVGVSRKRAMMIVGGQPLLGNVKIMVNREACGQALSEIVRRTVIYK